MTGSDRDPGEDVVVYDDADLMRRLSGPHDAHFALIEDVLPVRLYSPGGQVQVRGAPDARAAARRVLDVLYERLRAGQETQEADVRGALRLARTAAEPGPGATIKLPSGKTIAPRTPVQRAYVEALDAPRDALIFGIGPAGTGKTYLAVAHAARQLAAPHGPRLVVARPAVEAGERLGFLPGDLEDKVDPYMAPIWDALRDAFDADRITRLRDQGRIEVAPLAFMRGRTLSNAVVILDEAQNTTISQMKMALTRLGEGSRMIVTGDPSQVDLRPGEPSGLAHALKLLAGETGVKVVRFTGADVVRHDLVARIVAAYERDAVARTPEPAS